MNPFHIFVSVVNLLCGIGFIAVIYGHLENEFVSVFSMVGGQFANFFALLISIILLAIYPVSLVNGKGKLFIHNNWLGFFNGAFVVLCWALVLGYFSYANPSSAT